MNFNDKVTNFEWAFGSQKKLINSTLDLMDCADMLIARINDSVVTYSIVKNRIIQRENAKSDTNEIIPIDILQYKISLLEINVEFYDGKHKEIQSDLKNQTQNIISAAEFIDRYTELRQICNIVLNQLRTILVGTQIREQDEIITYISKIQGMKLCYECRNNAKMYFSGENKSISAMDPDKKIIIGNRLLRMIERKFPSTRISTYDYDFRDVLLSFYSHHWRRLLNDQKSLLDHVLEDIILVKKKGYKFIVNNARKYKTNDLVNAMKEIGHCNKFERLVNTYFEIGDG
jgi:hypothetical protein